jgi:hypothetical protein
LRFAIGEATEPKATYDLKDGRRGGICDLPWEICGWGTGGGDLPEAWIVGLFKLEIASCKLAMR